MRWSQNINNIQAVLLCRQAGMGKIATAKRLKCSVGSIDRATAEANKLGLSTPTHPGVNGDADASLIWARIEKEVCALSSMGPAPTAEDFTYHQEVQDDEDSCPVVKSLEHRGFSKAEARRTAEQYIAQREAREAKLRRMARSFSKEPVF
jgi:hypothetical protein